MNRDEWRQVLREQGRSLRWLAAATGYSYNRVANYATGRTPTPDDFIERAWIALGFPFVGRAA